MRSRVTVGIYTFIAYLVLTASTGNYWLWPAGEILSGLILTGLVMLIAPRFLDNIKGSEYLLNPKRVLLFIIYLGDFFYEMAKANLDVAYRVITGKINPGIVKVETGFEKDTSVTMLANSITLTPGTLTVEEEDGDLFVHWINVKDKEPDPEQVCGKFPEWSRRVAE